MSYLFTSESVSEGHPDKVSDQISDALIDNFLAFDPASKVACETLVTTGQVVLAGEVKTNTYLDVQSIARETIEKLDTRSQNTCSMRILVEFYLQFTNSQQISTKVLKERILKIKELVTKE